MTLNLLFFTLTVKWNKPSAGDCSKQERLREMHERNVVKMLEHRKMW
ncbi:MAG: YrzI family small protein [Bacillus sp. (in: firmicutes)]